VTHFLSLSLQEPVPIGKLGATNESEIDMVAKDSDVADAVFHPMGRAIENRDHVHLDDVLATGRQFFKDQLSQVNREVLNSPVEALQKIQELFGRFGHTR